MKKTKYRIREKTDQFLFGAPFSGSGQFDKLLRFVEKDQLLRRDLWHLAAKQFLEKPDGADRGWRGEYWGKLMRGACITYQYTKNEALYQILCETVLELLSYQDAEGRISAYQKAEEFCGWDIWSRKYVLLGMLHFYEICQEDAFRENILSAMERHLDYIVNRIGNKAGQISITKTSELWGGVNSSSILEPVVLMYHLTQKKAYLDFASYIVENGGAEDCNIFELAYENRIAPYQYKVTKAYELMSCFEGLIEYYRATGIEKWKIAAENFAQQMIKTEITVIGSAGCLHECLNHSVLMQTDSGYDGIMQETCVSVTWMKLCGQLLGLTGKSIYADCIEQTIYNALYGAVNTEYSTCEKDAIFDFDEQRTVYFRNLKTEKPIPQTFDSYSPLRAGKRGRAIGGFKSMENGTSYCGCCIAIGAAGVGAVPDLCVQRTRDGAVVNLYLNGASKLLIDGIPVQIKLTTQYPKNGYVSIEVETETEKTFSLMLRIPSFANQSRIKIDENELIVLGGGYQTMTRCWKGYTKIEMNLNIHPRMVHGMYNPDDAESEHYTAFFYGPIALARDARIEPVGEPISGNIDLSQFRQIECSAFPNECAFELYAENQTIRLVDYASAGKTWSDQSRMEVWIPTASLADIRTE